ncbi:MAG: GntR family transcriptional regulator [Oscillospiraceae bacterium]|nr:GntR family transcriptional regulator [Oscillospiraceae bacterium]
MIQLDLQSRVPIYEQLKSKICELAMAGALKPNDQLPSVRSFARDLGINPNTVQKTYQDLEREGIIYSVAGKGSFLSDTLHLNAHLERHYLSKLSGLAALAKRSGIPLGAALETVQKAYDDNSIPSASSQTAPMTSHEERGNG